MCLFCQLLFCYCIIIIEMTERASFQSMDFSIYWQNTNAEKNIKT